PVKGKLVLVGPFLRLVGITDISARAAFVIGVARAGIVGADRLPRQATEQLMDWLAGYLAKNIPKRDVYRRGSANFHARRAKADIGLQQQLGDTVDLQRVLVKKQRCNIAMDIGGDRISAAEGLAKPDNAFVGVDLHPQYVVEVRKLHRFDSCDLHSVMPQCADG